MSRLGVNNDHWKANNTTAEERFLRYKTELHQQLIGSMDLSTVGTMSEEDLRLEVRRAAEELCRLSSDLLSLSERELLVNEVLDETFGLGPIEPLMRDPTITDILINGPKTVYIERNGRLERVNIAYQLERWLGFDVDESTLAQLETIDELAAHLVSVESAAKR